MHHPLNKNGSGMYKLLHNTIVLNKDIDAFFRVLNYLFVTLLAVDV